jgi:hypothetical protein
MVYYACHVLPAVRPVEGAAKGSMARSHDLSDAYAGHRGDVPQTLTVSAHDREGYEVQSGAITPCVGQ